MARIMVGRSGSWAPRPSGYSARALEVQARRGRSASGIWMAASWHLSGVELVERRSQEGVAASSEDGRVQVWAAELTDEVTRQAVGHVANRAQGCCHVPVRDVLGLTAGRLLPSGQHLVRSRRARP